MLLFLLIGLSSSVGAVRFALMDVDRVLSFHFRFEQVFLFGLNTRDGWECELEVLYNGKCSYSDGGILRLCVICKYMF